MIWFLDASALVKRYVRERGSDVVRDLVRRRRPLAACSVSRVEVPAALWRRARGGDLDGDRAERLSARVALDLDAMEVVEVRAPVLDLAATLVSRHPLRAYDALQLAAALRLARAAAVAVTFACADSALAAAALAEDLRSLALP